MTRNTLSSSMLALSMTLLLIGLTTIPNIASATPLLTDCHVWIDPATDEGDCHGDCPQGQICAERLIPGSNTLKECKCWDILPPL